ncbi:FAD-dependent oxidoreductase [Lentzea aerocolonigenes]|uniref:FAD-dependent oxidoreductase n=1 Tax=Lentzea aerocolonigenes TaxID=68170 RepID=UPI00055EA903|nr:NAD(P)/FAD-dependent oxidoreductase [Lentzea aerocolonigenes]MCP2248080.1 2-methyl-3-hydroxypyridine 5-carboxylic acid dioxygenase [Lentzea aerocolonigenes]
MGRHVEIAGAGFAGLTVAIGLAQRGWSVRVHERGTELRDFGAGIFLWENGLRVLESIGCADRVLLRSHEARQWEERDSRGTLLGTRPLPLPGGLRMITLSRLDLYTALLDRARSLGVDFRTDSHVVEADPDGFLVVAGGTRWPADFVVAADGIRSTVRDQLGLLTGHDVFGLGMYRFLVPLDRAPGDSGQWRNYVNYWNLEHRRRVLYVPCNSTDLYLSLSAPDGDEEAIGERLNEEVWRASFPVLDEVLTGLPVAPRFDRYEVLRLSRWSVGSAAVVGDAAHAMPATLGQGAGTAMTNALNLAIAVAEADDIPLALKAWEAQERQETEATQDMSVALLSQLMPRNGEHRSEWTEEALRPATRSPRE